MYGRNKIEFRRDGKAKVEVERDTARGKTYNFCNWFLQRREKRNSEKEELI